MAKFLAKTLAKRNNFYAQGTVVGLLSKNSRLALQLKCDTIHDSQCSEFGHIKSCSIKCDQIYESRCSDFGHTKSSYIPEALSVTEFMILIDFNLVTFSCAV